MEKVALVTGNSKGLGAALSAALKASGYVVVGTARNPGEAQEDRFISGELTDPEFCRTLIETTVKEFGRIDLLVNNAGVGMYETWEEGEMADVEQLFALNVIAPVRLSKLALPHLKASKGMIVNVSSVAGKVALPYMGAYCASKSALTAFSDSLRAELLDDGVQVLDLIIGRVATGFSLRSKGGKQPPSTPGSTTADHYAKRVMRAIEGRERSLVFPAWYAVPIVLYRLLPRFFERVALKKFRHAGGNG